MKSIVTIVLNVGPIVKQTNKEINIVSSGGGGSRSCSNSSSSTSISIFIFIYES